MRKTFFLVVLFGLLSACQSPSSANATETPIMSLFTPPPPTIAATPTPVSMHCTLIARAPTPAPTEQFQFPPISQDDWVIGPETAIVTIIEYADFQCPGCGGLAPVLAKLLEDFPQDVRLVFRHFPILNVHDKAALATQAAEAAGNQGQFWAMHDLLFAHQADWVNLNVQEFQEWLIEQARSLGLDIERFSSDLLSQENVALAQKAWEDGLAHKIFYTPYLIVNGKIWAQDVPPTYENLSVVIQLTRLEQRQYTSCPPMVIDPTRKYFATLKTEKGEISLELFVEVAPQAVNNFVFLAREGWYDGVTFHRVLPHFVAQSGDPSSTGYGGPGYAFADEISPDLQFDREGVLAMANAGPGTNGSQFFITFAPTPHLNGKYTIFGQVISGMDTLEKLTPRDPQQSDNLPPGDRILTIVIEEK